jgi:serine phosphatase RsbU (regulator of sigma subunit)
MIARKIVDACFETVSDFRELIPAHDDITLVVIKKK